MAADRSVLTNVFTVVVPVHKAVNNFKEMIKWLDEVEENDIPASMVVVADSCDNQTKSLLLSLKDRYRFKLVASEVNSPGEARNIGLKWVTTDWVVFWDSDDIGFPKNVLSAIQSVPKSCQAIIGTYEMVDRDTRAITWKPSKVNRLTEIGFDPGLWRIIFRLERLKGHHFATTKMGEDQFFLAALNLGEEEVITSDLLFYQYFFGGLFQLTKDQSAILTLSTTVDDLSHLLAKKSFRFNTYVYVIYVRLIITSLKNGVIKPKKAFSALGAIPIRGILRLVVSVGSALTIKVSEKTKRQARGVTVLMTGGLGNQLFQLAAAMNASKGMIYLDMNVLKPRKTKEILDLDAFTLPPRVQINANPRKSLRFVTKTAGFLLRSGVRPTKLENRKSINKILKTIGGWIVGPYVGSGVNLFIGQGVGYTNLKNIDGYTMMGYFQSYTYINHPSVYEDLMSITPKKIGTEVQILISEALSARPIFVHFRLTDYLNETSFGIPDENYYREALNSLVKFPSESIWVFSDDITLAQTKFPVERTRQAIFIETNHLSPAEVLHLMRHGQHYVIANSSFSWWAAALRFHRNARVIAPKPWFLGQDEPKDMIFPDWERLETTKA